MAQMIPVSGPRQGASDEERRFFERCTQRLGPEYLVIHRPQWVSGLRAGTDGDAHFLIADPERGVVLLDLHASGLAYDPHSDGWQRPGGDPLQTNPVHALEDAARALSQLLASHPAAPNLVASVGWALVVPHGYAGNHGLGPQAPASRLLDRIGIDRLDDRISELFEHWSQHNPQTGNASSRWWWRTLEETFVAPRQIRVRLQEKMVADRAEILTLSDRQTLILEALGRMRRLTIYGPAGTGKTVLAIAKAKMLAHQGHRVLLTCYNKELASYLRHQTEDEPLITAQHFHELCWQRCDCDERGVRVPTDFAAQRVFFDEELPVALLHESQGSPPPFDALVVDEAQDFLAGWWDVLDAICQGGPQGIRYLFYDDRQCLRDRVPHVPGADQALKLMTNWRNTQEIHREMGRFEPRVVDTPCAAPTGVPVQYERVGDDLAQSLSRILTRLVRTEGVPAEDIVILTGKSAAKSQVAALAQPVGPVVVSDQGGRGAVRLAGIRAYKGLESPVVILTELSDSRRAQSLFYVGASRAMNHLIVMDDAWPMVAQ